ncbi:MAG: thiamine phosphate synthase [Chloroflexi bacterium]|nr:thiamine phosphate synthase [Chloroflexota bacterium]
MKFSLDVYIIVDLGFARGRSLPDVMAAVIRGGATVVQLREKKATTREILGMGELAKGLCRQAGIPLIINDRLDIAMALDADGVHLGPDDMPVGLARKLWRKGKIIGASAGTVEEALQARKDGADYLGVGAVYATSTKSDAGEPIGPEALARIKKASGMPVVGIGGVTPENTAPVIKAGADGVAVISAVLGAPDIAAAVRSLKEVVSWARL